MAGSVYKLTLLASFLASTQPAQSYPTPDGEVVESNATQLLPRARTVGRHFNRYVSLGDSFSAGPSASKEPVPGKSADNKDCFRTTGGWPQQLSNQIVPGTFQFSACTGLTTDQIREQQVQSEGSLFRGPDPFAEDYKPDLVTITTGGNDNNAFASVVTTCPYFYGRLSGFDLTKMLTGCGGALRAAEDMVNSAELPQRLDALLGAVTGPEMLAPAAVVLIMGYPALYNHDEPIGTDCLLVKSRRRRINDLVSNLNGKLSEAADRFNGRGDYQVIFANPNDPNLTNAPGDKTFDGNRFCEKENRAYFQGLPGQGPPTREAFLKGMFHPNGDGMTVMAQVAQNRLADAIQPGRRGRLIE